MHQRLATTLIFTLFLGGLSSACGDDSGGGSSGVAIDATAATVAANDNARTALMSAANALQALGQTDVLSSLPFTTTTECGGSVDGTTDCVEEPLFDFDLTDEATDLADWLADEVFTAANVVDESATSVTYQLPVSLLCDSSEEPLPGGGEVQPTLDPDCVDLFTQVPIRLRVRSPREGDIDVELLFGNDNPADIRLYADEIAVEIDLAEVRDVLVALVEATGEDAGAIPSTMRGRVSLSLTELTNSHAVATLAILSAIDVRSTGDLEFSVQLGASNPAARLELDAAADTISGLLDVGALEAALPTTALFGAEEICNSDGLCTGPPEGTVTMHVDGLSGTTSLSSATDLLHFQDVSLGNATSWAAVDGQRFVSIDLNASQGRMLDVLVGAIANGIQVSVAPALDLQVGLDLRYTEPYSTSELDSWLLDEVLGISLAGGTSPGVAIVDPELGTSYLEVIDGLLTLTSQALDLTLQASAGECMWGDDTVEGETAHPFEAMATGACPD